MSVTMESIVCIKDEINDLISCTNVETVTVPIDAHVSREHSIEHEILKFLECVGHLCFVHKPIIGDGVATATQVVPLLELSRRCGSSNP